MTTIERMDQHAKETQEIVQQVIDLWLNEVVFTWRWWFGLITTILTWLFWISITRKRVATG